LAEAPAQELELPLHSNQDMPSTSGDEEGRAKSIAEECTASRLRLIVVDIVASVAFWYALCFVNIPEWAGWTFLTCLVFTMTAWRVYRAYGALDGPNEDVPYTCGYVRQGPREMFLVATIHISPRAPRDVEEVIEKTRPDIAMIELDEDRLNRMRDEPSQEAPLEPMPEDLQPITISGRGSETTTFRAQRASWNGEWAGEVLRGSVVYDEGNAHGLKALDAAVAEGNLVLVERGSSNGEFVPFAWKAFLAHKAGAEAVLVINSFSGPLPMNRLGGDESLKGSLQVFRRTWSCGFPPVPVMLLTREDGERLRTMCLENRGRDAPAAELQVMPDSFPRRTLRKRLCHGCALIFSGIGILYSIIQCFSVEVGGEFLMAEIAAHQRGIPCACIDVDLDRFWARLGAALVPTPCNIFQSLWAWLAFPRVVFRFFFPPQGNIDVLGSMFLHGASFPCRTWIAFVLAGFCASRVTNLILELFGMAGEQAAERSGAVTVHSKEDRDLVQAYIMLLIEMYMLPQIYSAVADSRDEAMYQKMLAKRRSSNVNRCVVVVGAGHANGIIQRARERGL